jgi:peptide/nickel transport system permease protein
MADVASQPQTPEASEPTQKADIRGESLYSIAWRQFRKHPLARGALTILAIFYLAAAFADFIAPYSERFINTDSSFQPPNRIYWVDEEGTFRGPFIYPMEQTLDLDTFENVWTENRDQPYPIRFLVRRENRLDRYVPFPVNLIPVALRNALNIRPWATLHLFGLAVPDSEARLYIWGADDLGGDIFGKVLFGARISLTIGIVGSLVSIVIGLFMGGLAGYFSGWVDELIMRFVEALSAIPFIFLLLALSAIFYPLNWPPVYVFFAIVVVIGLIGWGDVARSVRSLLLSMREQDFTYAARALGAGDHRVIFRHLIPQTLSYVIVSMSLQIPSFILIEAVLSFYGLGIQPPATSWGLMLNTAQSFAGVSGLTERWWIFIPGIFIFISVLTWNLLGDGLRDAFDPRSRK